VNQRKSAVKSLPIHRSSDFLTAGRGFPASSAFSALSCDLCGKVFDFAFWLWQCRAVVKVLILILLFSVSPRLCGERVLVFLRLTAECQVLLLVAVMLRCE
jgi:hypothetical protein